MYLYQAHTDLANAIGDPIYYNGGTIPDGVRYSAKLRDQYIYRAMLQIIQKSLEGINQIPRWVRSKVIMEMFPELIKRENIDTYVVSKFNPPDAIGGNPDLPSGAQIWSGYIDKGKVLYTLGLYAGHGMYSLEIPKRLGDYSMKTRDVRNSQYPDVYYDVMNENIGGTIKTVIKVYDYANELRNYLQAIYIEYLPYPTQPDYETDPETQLLDFETSLYPKLITQATIYALIDSQDIQNLDRYLYPEYNKQ